MLDSPTPLILEIDTARQQPEEAIGTKAEDDHFLSLVNRFVFAPLRDNQEQTFRDLFVSLKYEPLYISQTEAPLDLPVETEAFHSQLSGLDFDQLDDVAFGIAMPRPSTWPTTDPSGRPVTPPRIEPLDTGKSSEATPSLSGSPVKSLSKKSPPPLRPDRLQATVSANAADKRNDQPRESRAAVTLRSRESIADYTLRVAEQLSERLSIPTSPRSQAAHLTALSTSGNLIKEKERTKAVLRKYDRIFEHKFGHAPSRQEKEPLRALYMYYRRVKHAIERVAERQPLAEPSPSSDRPSRRGGTAEPLDSRPGSSDAGCDDVSWMGQRSTLSESQLAKGANYPLTLEEAERKLDKLVQQKNMLAKRLQGYQEVFEKKNGRRIRYHRDIVEIESEYRRYKKLRSHISALTETIKARRFVASARGDVSQKIWLEK